MERAIVRRHRAPGEADSSTQELAALVEHALLDYLVGAPEDRRRNRQAERAVFRLIVRGHRT